MTFTGLQHKKYGLSSGPWPSSWQSTGSYGCLESEPVDGESLSFFSFQINKILKIQFYSSFLPSTLLYWCLNDSFYLYLSNISLWYVHDIGNKDYIFLLPFNSTSTHYLILLPTKLSSSKVLSQFE